MLVHFEAKDGSTRVKAQSFDFRRVRIQNAKPRSLVKKLFNRLASASSSSSSSIRRSVICGLRPDSKYTFMSCCIYKTTTHIYLYKRVAVLASEKERKKEGKSESQLVPFFLFTSLHAFHRHHLNFSPFRLKNGCAKYA